MGNRSSRNKEASDNDKAIARQQEADQRTDKTTSKLILLGSGESGKSTFFKQLNSLYGKGYSETDRKLFTKTFQKNIITEMRALCHAYNDHKDELDASLDSSHKDAFDLVFNTQLRMDLTQEVADAVTALWQDPGIRAVYDFKFRSQFQLADSASYYFSRAQAAMAQGFVPTYDDLLRARVRTTGVSECMFNVEGHPFTVVDVGGQRNERKKWVHQFETITAIIWVASAIEYDQLMFEDNATCRIFDTLDLFDSTVNSRWFHNTPIIMFLNKMDLLEERIVERPLTDVFPDFDAPETDDRSLLAETAALYLQRLFEQRMHIPEGPVHAQQRLWVHRTTATDRDNVKRVFSSTKDIVLRRSLIDSGLL
jgi:guanine nucleotide-binding protein G(i) subunit alpha